MRRKLGQSLLLLAFWLVCWPLQTVSADVGPKPTMEFSFTQAFSGPPVTIVAGTLFQCHQPDCSDAQPFVPFGQFWNCDVIRCQAIAHDFSRYNRLEIQFSDGKTRQSNIFEKASFNAQYKVTIRETDLQVRETDVQVIAQTSLGIFFPWLLGACGGLLLPIVAVVVFLILRWILFWRSKKS